MDRDTITRTGARATGVGRKSEGRRREEATCQAQNWGTGLRPWMARRGEANQAVDGKALPEMSALKPYWGKPAVRNFREGDGNNGIIEARSAPSPYSTVRNDRARMDMGFTDLKDSRFTPGFGLWIEKRLPRRG